VTAPRLIVGGLTAHSVVLGTVGANFTSSDLIFDPPTASIIVEDAGLPQLPGQVTRQAFIAEGLAPGTNYSVRAGASSNHVRFATLSETLASGPLRVGFASCYFPSRQFKGRPAVAEQCWELGGKYPHVILHCGDQVYADVPAMSGSLHTHFRERYEAAWREDQLGALFTRAGHYFTPDDHEYWNDFPRESSYLFQSDSGHWKHSGRVAADAFWSYQGLFNFPEGMTGGRQARAGWSHGIWSGVPFFITDSRSERSLPNGTRAPEGTPGKKGQFMAAAQFTAVLDWLGGLRNIGVLVIGQPLAASTSTKLFGLIITDYGLEAYTEQFRELMNALRTTLNRGVTVIVLTGDIHWGRLVEWSAAGRGRLIEYVASPIGRVGFRSILSDKHDGGPYQEIKSPRKIKDLDLLTPFLPGYERTDHFATGHNNVGSVTFEERSASRIQVTMQSYSLEFAAVAVNQWNPNDFCTRIFSVP
jgi:hypothetical protein